MSADSELLTLSVAVYLGFAFNNFFMAITRDLITPFFAALIPGSVQHMETFVIQLGPIKLRIGDAIGALLNLIMAYVVVTMTLPYIRAYIPTRK
jgi:large-conductance mechanosensitive channel